MDHSSGGRRGQTERFCTCVAKPGSALLRRQRPPKVNEVWETATGVWSPHGPLWHIEPVGEHPKDSNTDMPSLLLSWGELIWAEWPMHDRVIPDVPGPPERTVLLSGVRGGPLHRFTGGLPPDSERLRPSGTRVTPHPHPTIEESRLFWVSFLLTATMISWPVEGLRGRAGIRTNIRNDFLHLQVWDTIVILEEGIHPHSLCPSYDSFILWGRKRGIDPPRPSAVRAISWSTGVWRRRRCSQGTIHRAMPLATLLPWYHISNTWGGLSQTLVTTGRW